MVKFKNYLVLLHMIAIYFEASYQMLGRTNLNNENFKDFAVPVQLFIEDDRNISNAADIPSDVPLKSEALLQHVLKNCTKKQMSENPINCDINIPYAHAAHYVLSLKHKSTDTANKTYDEIIKFDWLGAIFTFERISLIRMYFGVLFDLIGHHIEIEKLKENGVLSKLSDHYNPFTIAKLMSLSYKDVNFMDITKDTSMQLVELRLAYMLLEAVYLKTDVIREILTSTQQLYQRALLEIKYSLIAHQMIQGIKQRPNALQNINYNKETAQHLRDYLRWLDTDLDRKYRTELLPLNELLRRLLQMYAVMQDLDDIKIIQEDFTKLMEWHLLARSHDLPLPVLNLLNSLQAELIGRCSDYNNHFTKTMKTVYDGIFGDFLDIKYVEGPKGLAVPVKVKPSITWELFRQIYEDKLDLIPQVGLFLAFENGNEFFKTIFQQKLESLKIEPWNKVDLLKTTLKAIIRQKLVGYQLSSWIVDILIIYAAADAVEYIPDDVYKLFQACLIYFNSIPGSALNYFWMGSFSEISDAKIIVFQTKILDKLTRHPNLSSEEAMQTNTIIVKLSLMIYTHAKFHSAMLSTKGGIEMTRVFLRKLVETLLLFFERRFVHFDLNDDHFIQILDDFFQFKQVPDILQLLTTQEFADKFTKLTKMSLNGADNGFRKILLALLFSYFNRRCDRPDGKIAINAIATDTDIKHLLEMVQEINEHIISNSKLFEIKMMFLAKHSSLITRFMSNSDKRFSFSVLLMKRFLDAMITRENLHLGIIILEIVYSINYQPNVPITNPAQTALYMHVALVAGLFMKMKPNEYLGNGRLRPFDSFILDKSSQAVYGHKQRFTAQMQQCFPKMNLPKRGTDGNAWYIS